MNKVVVHHRADWPADEIWRQTLLDWLTKTFTTYSASEIDQILAEPSNWHNLAWTFGSWLDQMKDRQWSWWSTCVSGNVVTIVIQVEGDPFSAKALAHLVQSAGGILVEQRTCSRPPL